MFKRMAALSGWLIAFALVLLAGTRTAAQPGAPEGAFVRAADGTIYAVSNGVRIRLAPMADSGNVLAGLREGPAVATVDELNAAIAATAPPPIVRTPADTLVGQVATVCASDVPFQAEAARAEWQRTVLGRTGTGTAMWVVVYVNMTNLSTGESSPYRGGTPAIQLIDERGRKFEGDLFRLFDLHNELAAANSANPFIDGLRPGITELRVVAFEVAPDVQRLTLASQFECPGS